MTVKQPSTTSEPVLKSLDFSKNFLVQVVQVRRSNMFFDWSFESDVPPVPPLP